MAFPTEELMKKFKLFWQYPVITEGEFFKQNKNNVGYIGFPWATIIDKRYNQTVIYKLLQPYIRPGITYYTCCQHIHFRTLFDLFKSLRINLVYSPHKIIDENKIGEIHIRSCPLYAANIEDPTRNRLFQRQDDMLTIHRKYLYSFQGAYNPRCYLTDIRSKIFKMKHPEKCFVKDIGGWHYESMVYSNKQNTDGELNENETDIDRTNKYNKLLLDSRYSLCPSGSGPNSIRFWESLAVGSIPVILADTLELPSHELWDDAIVRIPEKKIDELPIILSSISEEKEQEMRENCMILYKYYKNNYTNKKSKNMVVFSNCHGERYIDIFKRDTNIHNVFNINYIVSYQQLDNFSNFKDDFIKADVLIINNIKQYNDYTMGNLKKILKPSCMVIVIPFVRFEGYWMPEQYKQLKYVYGNAVSFFPNIEKNNIQSYLVGDKNKDKDNEIIAYFNKCLAKLKQIDQESDIRFYDFFVDNHHKFPFFRDNYHPTMNILEYIATQIIEKIDQGFDITYNKSNFNLKKDLFEWGHYKPMRNSVKRALKLEYDLDKVFLCNREKYLNVILDNETKHQKIVDLDDLRSKYFRTV